MLQYGELLVAHTSVMTPATGKVRMGGVVDVHRHARGVHDVHNVCMSELHTSHIITYVKWTSIYCV